MASTTFIDNQTVIYAAWLNDVNNVVYNGIFQSASITATSMICNGTASGAGFTNLINNTFASPAAIGNVTPNTGAFTTLSSTSLSTASISGLTTPLSAGQGGTGISSAGTSGYALRSTGSGWSSQKLGLGMTGETWHDVTSSRAFATTYTNSNSYPIMIAVSASQSGSSGNHQLNVYVSGITVAQQTIYAAGNSGPSITGIIVPPGQTYYADTTGSNATTNLSIWTELY